MVDRLDDVVSVVSKQGPLTLTEVAIATGLPRPTVHRLLDQLVDKRWVCRRDNLYESGMRILEFRNNTNWFQQLAAPMLIDLQRRSKQTVHLGYLDRMGVRLWDKVDGPLGLAIPTTVGSWLPAHRTALGKVLVAQLPPYQRACMSPEFLAEVYQAAGEGLAVDRGGLHPMLGCVAAAMVVPDREPESTTFAAVSVCGPVEQVADQRRLRAAVRGTATAIERLAAEKFRLG